jgi:hypothetical protein
MLALSTDFRRCDSSGRARTVEQQAHDLLEQHVHFRGRAKLFQYVGESGVLSVRGVVPTFYLKQLLQAALKGLEGTVRIDNQVVVAHYMHTAARRLEPVGV